MARVHQVGNKEDPQARAVRIVHISDTHLMHDTFVKESLIPSGDILVHSGDFDHYRFSRLIGRENDYLSEIAAINAFFSGMLHLYIIIININRKVNILVIADLRSIRQHLSHDDCL